MEFCWASMAAAASSLAADNRASSGPSMSATSGAVEARPPAGAAAAPAAAASTSALDSGGLKNTGNGDPPVGVPLISTVSYAPPPRHSAQSVLNMMKRLMHVYRFNLGRSRANIHAYMHDPQRSKPIEGITALNNTQTATEVHLVVAAGTD